MPRLRAPILLAAGLALLVACGRASETPRPYPAYAPASLHLVLVTLDTLRADRLPAYGYTGIATPALDAITLAPRHYQALFNLGRLLGARGEIDRQRELWQAALAANPELVRGYYYLAKLLMDTGGDLAQAEALTRQGLARDHEHATGPLGYYLLADLLNRTGRPREAREAVRLGRELEQSEAGRRRIPA